MSLGALWWKVKDINTGRGGLVVNRISETKESLCLVIGLCVFVV